MDERLFRIALSCMPQIGARRFDRLLEVYKTAKAAWQAGPRHWQEKLGLSDSQRDEALEEYGRWNFSQPDKWQKAGIIPILREDPEYPERLRHIFDPPPVLYVRGRKPPWGERAIAVVGTRKMSTYGRMMADSIARGLAAGGVTVVSGLARGIDGAAHRGALAVGGTTVAVLACGLDHIYPREHGALAEQIVAQGGALVSEYPPGIKPVPSRFPARNRIISGLVQGVVVAEGEVTSGSLITADFALEQGRDVFAVPGPVNVKGSRGPHRLLKQGAKLVESAADILEDLREPGPMAGAANITLEETLLLRLLEREGMAVDRLQAESGLEWNTLLAALSFLELKGLVAQVAGQLYIKCV